MLGSLGHTSESAKEVTNMSIGFTLNTFTFLCVDAGMQVFQKFHQITLFFPEFPIPEKIKPNKINKINHMQMVTNIMLLNRI